MQPMERKNMMNRYKVTIRQTGMPRSVKVNAPSSCDALLKVLKLINEHAPSRLIVREIKD